MGILSNIFGTSKPEIGPDGKVICRICHSRILPGTYKKFGGKCAPCANGQVVSKERIGENEKINRRINELGADTIMADYSFVKDISAEKQYEQSDALFLLIVVFPIVLFVTCIVSFPYLKRAIFPSQNIEEYYHEGQYSLPGKWVEIPLNERSFNSRHFILNLETTMNGGQSLKNKSSGEKLEYSYSELPNKILVGESSEYRNNVGSISFKLPKDRELYGKELMVTYCATFRYASPIFEEYFTWGRKNIGGVVNITIGTQKESFYSVLFNYVVILSSIPISILFSFIITKLIKRYYKDG